MHILSGQDGLTFLADAVHPSSDECIGLRDGVQKMFADGFSALDSNKDLDESVLADARDELVKEQLVCDEIVDLLYVVNGDAWSNRIDSEAGQPFAKSVDMLVPVDEDGSSSILFVEGKLGLAPRERRNRLRNPSYAEVLEKYCETKSKVCREHPVTVCRTMDLIVPVAVREVARNTFTRRNLTNKMCSIVPLDARGFLSGIEAACQYEANLEAKGT